MATIMALKQFMDLIPARYPLASPTCRSNVTMGQMYMNMKITLPLD